jgi:alcohol dehydrogenase
VLGIVRHPGAFQEFFTLPEANLHEIPESIPTSTAVFLEPLAAACEILDQISIPCGETVAVLGDGKLGLLVSMVLNAYGYPVHQYGRHESKLRIAGAVGVSTRLASEPLPLAEYAVVVEATGSPEGLRTAAAMTRPRGTLILKSTVHGSVAVDTAPIVVNEITVIGSRCGRFEAALPLLDHHLIPVERLISARFPLSEAPAAFACAATPATLKVLLEAVPSK